MEEKKRNKARTIDIWERLSENLNAPDEGDIHRGVWAHISIKPGGLWKEAEDETVILRRPDISKEEIWQQASDETVLLRRPSSLNIWEAVQGQVDELLTPAEEKQDIWKEVDDETVILVRTGDVPWRAPKIRDMGRFKPMRSVGWAIKQLETAKGETYWVLKNLITDAYLRLNDHQVYLWNLMDGSHSIQDMAVCMFLKYQTLSVDGLMMFVELLQTNRFLVTESVNVYQSIEQEYSRSSPKYWLKAFAQFLLQSEFSLKKIDEFYGAIYKWVGWLFFSWPVLLLFLLISLVGLPVFAYVTLFGEYSFLRGSTDSIGMGVVGIFLTQTVAIFIHESAHALTTKHYGRKVRRGGAGLYMGMLTFFMDTTDIWMEPRKPRLAVTWAGPFSGFLLGGIASLILLVLPSSTMTGFVYQFATLCIGMSIINLNPLLKLDGYYLLMDWLEIPKLRERSFNFVRKELLSRLIKLEKFTSEERIFTIFGLLSAVWTVVFVILLAVLYGGKLIRFLNTL